MSITIAMTRITHRNLMGKSKDQLAMMILDKIDQIGELQHLILRYSTHTNDCAYRFGHDCNCGLDETRIAAKEWIAS